MRPAAVIACLAVLAVAPTAHAVFHVAHISEVMSGVGADPSVQYVEISMDIGFQNAVQNTRLTAFNCDGSSHRVLIIVPSSVANEGAGVKWIMASESFAAASGIAPDFTWNTGTDGSIDPSCGMVCWGAPGVLAPMPGSWSETDANQYVDCIAYGGYSGPTKTSDPDNDGVDSSSGTPSALAAGDGAQSLTRTGSTNDNAADFMLAAPTPTNNAGAAATFGGSTTTTTPGGTTTTAVGPTTTTIPSTGKSKCSAKQLAAAGRKAAGRLRCESKAVTKGKTSKRAGCLAATEPAFRGAFAKAVAAGDCRTTTDAAAVEGAVDAFVNDVVATLTAGATARSRCTGKELGALAKKVLAKTKCLSKSLAKGNASKRATCLAGAEAKFAAAYARASAAGGCLAATDAATAEASVDAFIADLSATLAP